MNILSNSVHEQLSNHDKFVQLDNSDMQFSSKNVEKMHGNDNQVSSNTDNLPQDSSDTNSDHPYWTRGKWREYL